MKRLTFVLLLAGVVLVPATASAVTIQEIVALSRAGVADEVIIALIDRDRGVFPIEAAQLQELRTAGVSQAVVLAMLKSGLAAPSAPSLAADAPQVVIVGHGPDVPNTTAAYAYVPFFVPYVAGSVAGRGACAGTVENHEAAAPVQPAASSTNPFGRFMNDPMARFTNNGFVGTGGAAVVSDCQPAPPSPRRAATPRPHR